MYVCSYFRTVVRKYESTFVLSKVLSYTTMRCTEYGSTTRTCTCTTTCTEIDILFPYFRK